VKRWPDTQKVASCHQKPIWSRTAQTTTGLKLDGGTLRTGLRAAAAAAAAASASCFAARRAALLFVLGGIFGAAILLGRGLGLAIAGVLVVFSCDLEIAENSVKDDVGRIAATEAGRLIAYREGVAATDAWDAGRDMGCSPFEFVRESAGALGATGARTERSIEK